VAQALDFPGEWFFDNNTHTLSLWLPNSDSPTNHVIESKARLYAFNLQGKSYITISDLSIVAASVYGPDTSYITLQNVDITYAGHSMWVPASTQGVFSIAAVSFNPGNFNQLLDSNIMYSAGAGIYSYGVHNVAQNNVFGYLSYAPLLESVRMPMSTFSGLDAGSNRSLIMQNTLFMCGEPQIYVSNGNDIKLMMPTTSNCNELIWE